MYYPDSWNLCHLVVFLPWFFNASIMTGKNKMLEDEIKQLLEESKAENDALKKLIEALHREELRTKDAKTKSGESLKPNRL